ncbi:MAG: family 43 glycosylhydrolase [Armatimonadetes bacterium]|nr:family 43 glycosylhydrolase [Armatimonadota bacterium]
MFWGRRHPGLAALLGLLAAAPAHVAETNCLVRDPSTIVKRGDTYWIYGTGFGTQQFSSKDRIHWTRRGPALPKPPDWLAATVPANRNDVWAPDVHLYHGKYYLYSAYSQWGTTNSGIGVATSTTLAPDSWVEQGLVVHSDKGANENDIDPCVFEDAAGAMWLSYGSFSSGIKLIKLDPATGRQATDDTHVYSISSNGEASYVYYRDGYYYLWVNWDSCCSGSRSRYNIRMGRSRTVTGPYLDTHGKDMMQGGGTLFLGSVVDDGTGRPPDDEVGPGHVGILHDADGYWLSTHYEWARDRQGATTVNVQRLAWDSDGWPRAVLDPGPYKLTSFLSTHEVLTGVKGPSLLQTWPDKNANDQSWTLGYEGDGYYSLLENGSTTGAMTARDAPAKPGTKAGVAPFARRDTQMWYLQQNDDGTYTVLAKSGGKTLALDIGDCSLVDGSGVGLWTSLGNNCQKWQLHRR